MKRIFQEHAKAAVAFVGIFVAQVIARVQDPTQGPLPPIHDIQGWAVLLATAFVGAAFVYFKKNKLSAEQVASGFTALPEPDQKVVVAKIGPGPYA